MMRTTGRSSLARPAEGPRPFAPGGARRCALSRDEAAPKAIVDVVSEYGLTNVEPPPLAPITEADVRVIAVCDNHVSSGEAGSVNRVD
jgi:hypothetical protein